MSKKSKSRKNKPPKSFPRRIGIKREMSSEHIQTIMTTHGLPQDMFPTIREATRAMGSDPAANVVMVPSNDARVLVLALDRRSGDISAGMLSEQEAAVWAYQLRNDSN